MSQTLNKFHKEYSCVPQIVEEEKENIAKRFSRNKKLWVLYGALLISSFLLLPIWMTSLICLGGFILFPATMYQKELLKENPFLVVDAKYVQFKGKIISWNSMNKIIISHEILKQKENRQNYHILFKYCNGKEVNVDTCYFTEQEDIVNSIITLANKKNILIEREKQHSNVITIMNT